MQRVKRETLETSIKASFADSDCQQTITTDLPFLTHMLAAFCCHGGFPIEIHASGDVQVDPHHLVEDCGYTLGKLFSKQFNLDQLIRTGSCTFPMDEALALVAVDLSGRPMCIWKVEPAARTVGGNDISLFREFFWGFARGAGGCIHTVLIHGTDAHHSIEAIFKAFGRALSSAVQPSPGLRTTKGVFDGSS